MSSYRQHLYHIVTRTKNNLPAIKQEYSDLTCSFGDLERLIAYIKNQQNHHRKESFEDEYTRLLEEAGIKIDNRYFP